MKVYAVGVIHLRKSDKTVKEQRLWFLFEDFESAQKCILENHSDVFECYYNYALIEEIYVNGPALTASSEYAKVPKQWWYAADYSEPDIEPYPKISSCKIPDFSFNIVCFWVG